MQWLRLYTDVLDDPKVQRLPDHLFKTWVNLLCLARKHDGKLPADIEDIAFALRLHPDEMRARLDALKDAGLFDDGDGGPEPHNWNGRQFKSDHDAAERMKRSRAKKALRNTKRNSDNDVTPPEQSRTDTDTEQNAAADARAREVTGKVVKLVGASPVKSPNWMAAQSVVTVWLQRGADPELDIYPTVSAMTAKRQANGHDPPSSPKYFTQAIDQARADRERTLNAPEPESGRRNHSNGSAGTKTQHPARAASDAGMAKAFGRG